MCVADVATVNKCTRSHLGIMFYKIMLWKPILKVHKLYVPWSNNLLTDTLSWSPHIGNIACGASKIKFLRHNL